MIKKNFVGVRDFDKVFLLFLLPDEDEGVALGVLF